jgi:hypothetical protein
LVSIVKSRQTQYVASMQTGRIGFAYAFNPLRWSGRLEAEGVVSLTRSGDPASFATIEV